MSFGLAVLGGALWLKGRPVTRFLVGARAIEHPTGRFSFDDIIEVKTVPREDVPVPTYSTGGSDSTTEFGRCVVDLVVLSEGGATIRLRVADGVSASDVEELAADLRTRIGCDSG